MRTKLQEFTLSAFATAAGALALIALSSPASAHDQNNGIVYTMTNAASGNAVLVFNRTRDGRLISAGSVNTGGTGTGSGLGSQGAIALDRTGHWLFVVNAGSNDLSVFASDDDGLKFADRVPTGGLDPISVTEHHGLVYVLNAGSNTVNGFWIDRHGKLKPINGASFNLGSNVGAAEVKFSPDGDQLVVTEKASGNIVVLAVGDDGTLTATATYPSPTPTPYGFDFGRHQQFFVSEANGGASNASSVSSYALHDDAPTIISKSVATDQTAACWLITTHDGRFVYAADAGSGVLSGYAVSREGRLNPLNNNGQTALIGAGTHPSDMAVSRGSEYLYSLNTGNGTITGFHINQNGSLNLVGSTSGIPLSAEGIAAK